MTALSIVYCNDAHLSPENLEELVVSLAGVKAEIFEVVSAGPFSSDPLSTDLMLHRIPSLGHALAELTGEMVHFISSLNTWLLGADYLSVSESLRQTPQATLVFISSMVDHSVCYTQNEKEREVRRTSFLRILNKEITGAEFRRLTKDADSASLLRNRGTFLYRRSALAVTPPPSGVDEATALAFLPLVASLSGSVINRCDLTLNRKAVKLEPDPYVETEPYKRRELVTLGWTLEWWLRQVEPADLEDFIHTLAKPVDLLRLAYQDSRFTKILSLPVLRRIDLISLVTLTKEGIDGGALLEKLFANLEELRGIHFNGARMNELIRLVRAVKSSLFDLHSLHESVDSEMAVAEQALEKGEFTEAAKLYEAATKKYPNLVDAYFGWAESASKLGQLEIVKNCVNFITSRSGRTPAFNIRLGNLLFRLGEVKDAKQLYQQSIMMDSNNPSAYFNMAIILTREGKIEEALRNARAALRCQPGDASLLETVAFLEFRCGDKDQALSMLSSVAKDHPQRAETQALLQQIIGGGSSV